MTQGRTRRNPPSRTNEVQERFDRIARLVADGKTNKEIALAIGKTVPYVKDVVSKIFVDYGAQSRVQLAIAVEREAQAHLYG
jgi:DNA-binding NarL/FixJ family response regulator